MSNRGLVGVVAATLALVALALLGLHSRLDSRYRIAGTDRLYTGFIFVWDWWERAEPAQLDDDADIVMYASSVGGYALFPYEIQERGRWLVRRTAIDDHRVMSITRYNQPNLLHFSPFFAEHSERRRLIIVADTGLLGFWDAPASTEDVILASLFEWRVRFERAVWPRWLQYDSLAEVREANAVVAAQSGEQPFARLLHPMNEQTPDGILQARRMGDGIDGLRFTELHEPALAALRQFVEDGNEVWILSYARSEALEPVYGPRMERVHAAVAGFAEQQAGIEYLRVPSLPADHYYDHGHYNPAGAARFAEWFRAQLAARAAEQPLPGRFR